MLKKKKKKETKGSKSFKNQNSIKIFLKKKFNS